ncbi:TIGR04283 family arsenosugar biosynthesis glycosyltransferase [Tissierella carlieri]|jgi:rSAM/selenodomain-associated transferase 2|uniref:TIGR04283 family arsenosugar biosynthesis glycosyltransferase n=1 Tax=Tissierella TaxID=41273 RepID=UPI000B9FF533|nr:MULTISPECIES: TIGR04283 family arsenosugar biosynthesis glycosyltransferase [Tissierella]MBU5311935.1 TIGR04283 family arsenosugar biosynthesis glycosyltransferase [Tissierella carlieri]MDU5080483.1 TIGR04283 family arsenosugar biosynthesis glycosyltransferase [Bacillota bacterium]OZV13990.1 glycosyl transferase [Tissierella sp. P1]
MVSIIVPALNEEKTIKENLENLIKIEGNKEIIVVDGGSCDKTVDIAKKYAIVINSTRGRARQMNAGAKIAKGNILWFVHSDSKLEKNSILEMEQIIEDGYIGGCFKLYFYDLDTPFMRYVSNSSNRRAKYLKLIFGDQGIFMRKDIFEELMGYKEMELMEDWEFSRRIHKLGKMKVLDKKIGTSARRFKEGGQLKTLLLMHKIKILYMLGTPADKLAKIYRQVR